MINIIISAILVAVVGTASFYIWKEKKKGKLLGYSYIDSNCFIVWEGSKESCKEAGSCET